MSLGTRVAARAPVAGVLVVAMVLAGFSEPRPDSGNDAGSGNDAADDAGAGGPDEQEYEVVAVVLESPDHGPRLCSGVDTSYPPQCGGPGVVGWDWDAVESESADGSRWGTFALVGTWDGERFTLTAPAGPADGGQAPEPDRTDLTSPCPEPAGGWQPVDPATATDQAQAAAIERASTAPDFGGAWLDGSVLNLRFTGDLEERERWIREVWGGPLCVVGADHTEAELIDVQERLISDRPDLRSSYVDVPANAVHAQVYVHTPELEREIDQRYGEGAVELTGWLKPVG